MIESPVNEAKWNQSEGLTLKELEAQTVELLPNRVELRRHRRNIFVNNVSKCNGDLINLNVIANQCNG